MAKGLVSPWVPDAKVPAAMGSRCKGFRWPNTCTWVPPAVDRGTGYRLGGGGGGTV